MRTNRFHIWTIGCQMNEADSERLGGELQRAGYLPTESPEQADIIVLNSCVVRQGAEDKVASKLGSLRTLKERNPDLLVALMGCMVGPKTGELQRRFPHVDVFMRPQAFDGLLRVIEDRKLAPVEAALANYSENGYYLPPPVPTGVTSFVPVIKGCDEMCTYCIVPLRRGRQRSRTIAEIKREVEALAAQGVKEVTLLGQTVDAYGLDLEEQPDLADLFEALDPIPGIERIRFLTSHPRFMSQRIVDAIARLPKVCEHVNLPFQAGDDDVLRAMRRTYTREEYLDAIRRIKATIPGVSLSTDVIVGFPGETEEQFERTLSLMAEVRFDVVHVAMYSPRPGTLAYRTLPDDVPPDVKKERLYRVEELQKRIASELAAEYQGKTVEVLVEERHKGRWKGRTRTNRLVFFDDDRDLTGQLLPITIEQTSPWSLQGRLAESAVPA